MRSGVLIALGCALAAPAHAQLAQAAAAEAPTAPEAAAAPVRVWYRSSEGCPDGVSFVARLGQLGRPAALAGVGDRVDFVVTLAARADASAGRRERQTERGTVAIREVESLACTDVAEALAQHSSAFRWTEAGAVQQLTPGFGSRADVISADGSLIVGQVYDGAPSLYAWTEARGARGVRAELERGRFQRLGAE